MTILDLGAASQALRRNRTVAGGHRRSRTQARAQAIALPPLAWRHSKLADAGAAVLDLALCLILAATVVALLFAL